MLRALHVLTTEGSFITVNVDHGTNMSGRKSQVSPHPQMHWEGRIQLARWQKRNDRGKSPRSSNIVRPGHLELDTEPRAKRTPPNCVLQKGQGTSETAWRKKDSSGNAVLHEKGDTVGDANPLNFPEYPGQGKCGLQHPCQEPQVLAI